jgi:sugar lactone lactonase YvrE
LNNAFGVAVDTDGNIYIADTDNHRIRKISNSDGTISTIAGNSEVGYAGDGGPATRASLSSPAGVAVDAAGNLYVADLENYRIRKVSKSDGTISTIAGNGLSYYHGDGGAATSAGLSRPIGIAVDKNGNVYIAEEYSHRIRKVQASDGTITTVAGNGFAYSSGDGGPATSASLFRPKGVALDAEGNIYIADWGNFKIRKVKISDGTISTVAGSGSLVFGGDGGPATSAGFSNPSGVAVDAIGNIYIAIPTHRRIRKVSASDGTISTIAGTGTPGYSGDGGAATSARLFEPGGVAVDATGNVFIADIYNQRIRKITVSDGTIQTVAGNGSMNFLGEGLPATSAGLSRPSGIALDAAGNLFVSANNRIRKVSASDGTIHTVAGTGTSGFSGDAGPATSANLRSPKGIAVDASGNLYIADYNNHRIRKVHSNDGTISTVVGSGTAGFSGDGGPAANAQLNFPVGVAVDAAGNLYIGEEGNRRIRKVNSSDSTISTIAGNGTIGYGGDGGAATDASISAATSMIFDAAGNILFADHYNHCIRKINGNDGTISTIAGSNLNGFSGDGGPATSAQLTAPSGVALDKAGNIYIADRGNNRIRFINIQSGTINSVTGTGSPTFSGDGGPALSAGINDPYSVVVDQSGNLFISDSYNNRIRLVSQTISTLQSGNWEDLATWNLGRIPQADDKVILDQSHTVTINSPATAKSVEYRSNAQLLVTGTNGSLQIGQ